jgi:hypothetical protein
VTQVGFIDEKNEFENLVRLLLQMLVRYLSARVAVLRSPTTVTQPDKLGQVGSVNRDKFSVEN